ncbi:MAG TPA: lantibiotic dehydratase [Thermoanaerobaculia bacterium]|jgi:thiopeptide-type bacteriocin biosynthesis protein|nr:lantibiotic dehydratase [Thermoanaerobaculia bacterium]
MALTDTVRKPNRYERRRQRLDGADFEPQGFFLFRTPLLPVDELERWSAGLRAPASAVDPAALAAAIEADREELRGWLSGLLTRPDVIEALYVATPALLEGLAEWRSDPDGKKGRRAEESLVRYVFRMAARATPFGMFAGCTAGRVGTPNRLRLPEQRAYRRHSRLDMAYLFSLSEELNQDRELRRSLRYRPNTSIYRAAGRLRYAEARLNGSLLNYHLIAVEPDEYLDAALALAADGATPDEIAAAVAASDPDGEISIDDAAAYVSELIDSQLLVSELWPTVTGPEAEIGLIDTLKQVAAPAAEAAAATLRRAHEALEELDRQGLGNDPDRYSEIVRGLEPLPARADPRRLFQVDLFKPGDVVLDPAVLDEVARGIEALHRLESPTLEDELEGFRERFIERYGMQRLVPLVEALDVEAGVGKPRGIGGDAAPLLEGLDFSPAERPEKIDWGPREDLLLGKLMRAQASGAFEIVIDDDDLKRLETPERPPLPDSFQAMAVVGAAGEEALDAGDFLVWVRSVFGPSSARLAGRFCHGNAEIARAVSEQLREEEALDPDALFAEVVHVGPGRTGNIASRPVLRDWEIPYLGVSGAPRERQIPIDDLLVTAEGMEIVLYSARLGRRVQPRLTSAHNFLYGGLAVYRFLCSLQAQDVRPGLQWSWRPFEKQPFLPRVRYGRAILSRACWRVTAEEIKDFAARRDADRYAAVRRWREQRGIPRRLLLSDEDAEMFIDFDHVLSLDTFLATVRKSAVVELTELWHGFDALPARGPEGRFVHELTIPFVRRRTPARRFAPSITDEGERILPPTSRWLYLKLYTGSATADLVLRDAIAPLATRAMESGAADRWFFVRYGDPEHHLRVRFGGEPSQLRRIIDFLPEFLDPLLAEGRIARWQLDTYEREVERYGGSAGTELAERIFHADSEAVLAALDDLAGDSGADWRWRLALIGIDRMLADFGLDLAARRDMMADLRASDGKKLAVSAKLTQQLAQRLRESGDELYDLLTGTVGPDHPLAGSLAALDRRSERLAPLVAELRALASRGELTVPVRELLTSYVHMFVNRLVRSDLRAHELVLHDLLHRLTVSRLARREAAPEAPTQQETDPRTAPAS